MLRNSRPSYSFARDPSGGFFSSVFLTAPLEAPGIVASRTAQMPRFRRIFFKTASRKAGILFGAKPQASDSLFATARRQRCFDSVALARSRDSFRFPVGGRSRSLATRRRAKEPLPRVGASKRRGQRRGSRPRRADLLPS